MKLHGDLTINNKQYRAGDSVPWYWVYPFFAIHMLAFGLSGFLMAYSSRGPETLFLYLHGGFAIVIYLVFYRALFGWDRVRWMFINAALGLFGIYAQIDWILSWFGRRLGDFPWYVHAIPFGYYILYTFLLYQMVMDISGARDSAQRRARVEMAYVLLSTLVYGAIFLARP